MNSNVQEAILLILYEYFLSNPQDTRMVFSDLCKKINSNPNEDDIREIRKELFKLKHKGWVDFQFLDQTLEGEAWIEPDGLKITESLEKKNQDMDSTESSTVCPQSLGELIEEMPAFARLIQREDLLKEIIRYITQTPDPKPNHIVIYGQPMVGKTKFLEYLSNSLSDRFVPLMITGQGLNSINNMNVFLFDLVVQLTDKFNKWGKKHDSSNGLFHPDKNEFSEGKAIHAFHTIWKKILQISGERKPFVIFDEIEHLLDYHKPLDERILNFVDEFIRNPENGYFILAGSERIRFSQNEQFSMLIAKGQLYPVHCFDEGTSRKIFSSFQKYIGYEEEFLDDIIALCDGHPRIINNMYESMASFVNELPDKRNITTKDFETILTMLIERTSEVLWALRWRLTNEERIVLQLICPNFTFEVWQSEFSINELWNLRKKQTSDTSFDLETLRKGVIGLESREWIDWVDREEELFRFKLIIFPVWIRRNHIDLFK